MFKNIIWIALFIVTNLAVAQNQSEKSFFIDVNAGITYRIEGEQTQSQFHRKTTQTVPQGMQYGITGYYKPSFLKNTHLGIKYLHNRNKDEENTSLSIIDGQTETGVLKNKSQLNYFGISSLSSFTFGDGKNEAFFEPSVGYFHFNQEIEIDTKQTIKGGNIGFSATFGYLRKLSNHFSLGLNVGYLNANLENYTLKNSIEERKVEAARVDAIVLSSIHSNIMVRYKL